MEGAFQPIAWKMAITQAGIIIVAANRASALRPDTISNASNGCYRLSPSSPPFSRPEAKWKSNGSLAFLSDSLPLVAPVGSTKCLVGFICLALVRLTACGTGPRLAAHGHTIFAAFLYDILGRNPWSGILWSLCNPGLGVCFFLLVVTSPSDYLWASTAKGARFPSVLAISSGISPAGMSMVNGYLSEICFIIQSSPWSKGTASLPAPTR